MKVVLKKYFTGAVYISNESLIDNLFEKLCFEKYCFLPKHIMSIEVACVNRDVTTGCMRLMKPRRVFSRPANLATPF